MKLKANIDFAHEGETIAQGQTFETDNATGRAIMSAGNAFEVYPEPGSEEEATLAAADSLQGGDISANPEAPVTEPTQEPTSPEIAPQVDDRAPVLSTAPQTQDETAPTEPIVDPKPIADPAAEA